jgi:RNA recognition motif-containing protein
LATLPSIGDHEIVAFRTRIARGDAPCLAQARRGVHQMGRKLYVGNLPYDTGEQDLQDLFARAGAVESVNVIRDMATGRARGFAFVEMGSDEDARKAIAEFHDQPFGGRTLTVNEARPKAPRPGGGGGFGGGGGGGRRREPRW